MELKQHSKRFTVIGFLVILASALGIRNGISATISGQEIFLGLLSMALGILGGMAVFRYFTKKIIEAWMYYAWLIPQTITFTINTLDFLTSVATRDLVYDTYLMPRFSFVLAWELKDNSFLLASFNLVPIVGILVLGIILSQLKKDENFTEKVAGGDSAG